MLKVSEDLTTLTKAASLIKEVAFQGHMQMTYNDEGYYEVEFLITPSKQEAWDDLSLRLEGWEAEDGVLDIPQWYRLIPQ